MRRQGCHAAFRSQHLGGDLLPIRSPRDLLIQDVVDGHGIGRDWVTWIDEERHLAGPGRPARRHRDPARHPASRSRTRPVVQSRQSPGRSRARGGQSRRRNLRCPDPDPAWPVDRVSERPRRTPGALPASRPSVPEGTRLSRFRSPAMHVLAATMIGATAIAAAAGGSPLSRFVAHARVLVISAPTSSDPDLRRQDAELKARPAEVRERDLVVVRLVGDQAINVRGARLDPHGGQKRGRLAS